jgi:hypothetical protein
MYSFFFNVKVIIQKASELKISLITVENKAKKRYQDSMLKEIQPSTAVAPGKPEVVL